MKYRLYLLLLLAYIPNSIHSQNTIQWERNYGGSLEDVLSATILTSDGGYIAVGSCESDDVDLNSNHGLKDICVLKIDSLGDVQWSKTFGGSNDDMANDIIQSSDGGYIITGFTKSEDEDINSNQGLEDAWVLKLDSLGGLEWENTYGGSNFDIANSVIELNDGCFAIAGHSKSSDGDVSVNYGSADYWIFKIAPLGELIWETSWGSTVYNGAKSIDQNIEGDILIAGNSFGVVDSNGNGFGCDKGIDFLKFSSDGVLLSHMSHCFTGNGASVNQMQVTSDNGLIMVGHSPDDFDENTVNLICKKDSLGQTQWCKSYALGDGSLGNSEQARSVYETIDNQFVVTGDGLYGKVSIFKIENDGSLIWSKFIGGPESERPRMIIGTNDLGFLAAGSSKSIGGDVSNNYGQNDFWLVKFSPEPADSLTFITQEVCSGDSIEINNLFYSEPGIFYDTISDNEIIQIEINLLEQYNIILDDIYLCYEDSIPFFNQVIDTAGDYSNLLFTIEGCDSIINLSAIFSEEIVIEENIKFDNQEGLGNISINITGGTEPYEVMWSNGEINILEIDSLLAGEYSVQIVDAYGCEQNETYYIATTTSIDRLDHIFEIYPNPNRNQLFVEGEQLGGVNFEIYNASGLTLISGVLDTPIISTTDLIAGIYYIKLFNNTRYSILKFVKQE